MDISGVVSLSEASDQDDLDKTKTRAAADNFRMQDGVIDVEEQGQFTQHLQGEDDEYTVNVRGDTCRPLLDRNDSVSEVSLPAMIGATYDDDDDDDDDSIRLDVDVHEENKRLRSQVAECLAQIAYMRQQQYHIKKISPETRGRNRPVLVELPESLKLNMNARVPVPQKVRNGVAKEERSSTTNDDQVTVEPGVDLDAHLSSSGLHQRGGGAKAEAIYAPVAVQHGDQEMDGLLRITNQNTKIEESNDSEGPDGELGFWQSLQDRGGWLVGLLVLQSMSSFILARNEALLERHLIIIQFLTMLVGAGGNAGNQASVRAIRGLAVGTVHRQNASEFLLREVLTGLCLSIILGVAGCVRAAVFSTPIMETVAITMSLFMIVMISIVLGAMLPLGMSQIGLDPAHSSTTIQVIMDILGVTITVAVSQMVLG